MAYLSVTDLEMVFPKENGMFVPIPIVLQQNNAPVDNFRVVK